MTHRIYCSTTDFEHTVFLGHVLFHKLRRDSMGRLQLRDDDRNDVFVRNVPYKSHCKQKYISSTKKRNSRKNTYLKHASYQLNENLS